MSDSAMTHLTASVNEWWEPGALPLPAGALAQFEDARAAPYRVASGVTERPVSFGEISHIGQCKGLDILYGTKVRDDRTVMDRGLQQGSAVGWRRLVVELMTSS